MFLDEIADISPSMQAKLLRVVEQQEVKPVGATESFRIDARLVAATNKDLADEVRAGRFREDLLYRLNVVHVALPPLRDRREDIPALAAHFLRRYAQESGKTITGIAPETMRLLEAYAWPGNVRELENVIERGRRDERPCRPAAPRSPVARRCPRRRRPLPRTPPRSCPWMS